MGCANESIGYIGCHLFELGVISQKGQGDSTL